MSEVLSVCVLVVACGIPVGILGFVMLVVARRLAEHNRDLLKATLALAENRGGLMAAAMETTDREAANPPTHQRMRQVGS